MEDVKWLLRRCGLPILLLLIFGVYEEKSVNKNFYDNSWLVSI